MIRDNFFTTSVHTDKYLHKWIKRKFKKKELGSTDVHKQCDQTPDENRNAQGADGKVVNADGEAQQSDQSKYTRESTQPSLKDDGKQVTYETMKKLPTDAFGDISFIPKVNKSGNTSKVGKFRKKEKKRVLPSTYITL